MLLPSRPLSRRKFVRTLARGAGAVFAVPKVATSVAWASPGTIRSGAGINAQRNTDSLAGHASAKGLIYGAAIRSEILVSEPDLAAAFAAECGLLGAENDFKWQRVHPAAERYDFGRGDLVASFAQANGHMVNFHAYWDRLQAAE